MTNPHIKTALPGPNARAMLARDVSVASPSYPRDYPFVMSHGRGTEVWDVDGNRFLDFVAGIAVCSTGHAHPKVVAAIKAAADKFLHVSSDYWHENMTRLTERLAEVAPMGEPVMSFLCQSGTESVEGAIKLARYVTGRPRFIGFLGAFHGRTMGSLSFTSSKYTQQKGFAPTMPGVTHVPYPNPYRPLFAGADQGKAVLDYIRMLFERNVPAAEVAAIMVEPLQGEGGYLWPPEGFLAGLRALCDEHGILLIFNEVQSGIGRTGKMFACEYSGVRPDILTSAKGLGSGMPIGAIIAKKEIMEGYNRQILGYGRGVTSSLVRYVETLRRLHFANSDGTSLEQEKLDLRAAVVAIATRGGETHDTMRAFGSTQSFEVVRGREKTVEDVCSRASALLRYARGHGRGVHRGSRRADDRALRPRGLRPSERGRPGL